LKAHIAQQQANYQLYWNGTTRINLPSLQVIEIIVYEEVVSVCEADKEVETTKTSALLEWMNSKFD
jgi:hypothetical protein